MTVTVAHYYKNGVWRVKVDDEDMSQEEFWDRYGEEIDAEALTDKK